MTTLLSNNFNGIQHIGLPVTDIDRSREFYRRFGFEEVMGKSFAEHGGTTTAAMMQRQQVIIELYQQAEPLRTAVAGRVDGHIDHIAFSVADIDLAFAELTAAGITPIEPHPLHLDFWARGCRYFAVRGPDGEKLEFNQIL